MRPSSFFLFLVLLEGEEFEDTSKINGERSSWDFEKYNDRR